MSANVTSVRTDNLAVGMTVVRFDEHNRMIIDCRLEKLIPGTRGCRGLHFLTARNESVCYLPGGKVQCLSQ